MCTKKLSVQTSDGEDGIGTWFFHVFPTTCRPLVLFMSSPFFTSVRKVWSTSLPHDRSHVHLGAEELGPRKKRTAPPDSPLGDPGGKQGTGGSGRTVVVLLSVVEVLTPMAASECAECLILGTHTQSRVFSECRTEIRSSQILKNQLVCS